jgi:hypothetical protein
MTIEELMAEHTAKTLDFLTLTARADKLQDRAAEARTEASEAEDRVHRVEKELINALRDKAVQQQKTEDAAQREMDATHKGSSFP